MLRREHRALTAARALRPADMDVEQRPLSSYDVALGLIEPDVDDHLGAVIDDLEHALPATGTTGAAGVAR